MKKDSIVKCGVILLVTTLIAGVLLGFANSMTADAIAEQEVIKTNNALEAVLPDATFEELSLQDDPSGYVTNVYEATDDSGNLTGYAILLTTYQGYGGEIDLVAGFSVDGTISGIDIITQSETPGLGAQSDEPDFKDQFAGKAISELNLVKDGSEGDQNIDAIGGATITSRAVTKAVNGGIEYYQENLKEGE